MKQTFLCEQFYLLSIDSKKDHRSYPYLEGGLILAGLLDLQHLQLIKIDEEKIYLQSYQMHPHSFLEKLQKHVTLVPNGYKLKDYFLNMLYEKNELRTQLEEELMAKGVLERRKKKFLSIFPYVDLVILDDSQKTSLIEEIRHRVLHEKDTEKYIDELLLILSVCKMEEIIFSISELAYAKKRIQEILSSIDQFLSLPLKNVEYVSNVFVYVDSGCQGGDSGGGCNS